MQRNSCNHLVTAKSIPHRLLNHHERLACSDCGCPGPNLWICMYRNCCHIGCSENDRDHSTIHNADNPAHCIHMNWATKRIWCYICNTEVFMDHLINSVNYDSDQEMETAPQNDGYDAVRTGSPERRNVFAFDKTVGLNVGMSGDSYDGSDAEETVSTASPERPFGLVGLKNMGNTCYMNAALQALSNATPLTRFFLDCPAIVQILSENKKPCLSRSYQNLMTDMWKKNAGSVSPSGILYGIRLVHAMFRGFYQHDTQEFLRNFMDQLHEELKQITPVESAASSCSADSDTFSLAMSSSYDSSEGEYETCDSGVSERSSLSDDTERPSGGSTKRRLSRSSSPGTGRHRARLQSASNNNMQVINSQPGSSSSGLPTSLSSSSSTTVRKQFKFRSIISDVFDGKLLSSVQCLTCDRISSKVETFQDLSLPIPSRDHLVVLHGRPSGGGPITATCSEAVMPINDGWVSWIWTWLRSWFYGPLVTLHDCLAAFFSTDELKGDNMYSCERCNKLRNGVKFSKVLQAPEILCIHLKRFRHELMFSSKISAAVSFPLKGLDMRPYLHGDCVSKVTTYELFSVICHYGTAGGGHYICYALNDNQWYEFDDQYVTKVTAERVQSCEAYVLFYRKSTSVAEEVRNKAKTIYERSLSGDTGDAFISRQWISRFNTCAEPGPIDNSDFLCQHGSVNPDRELMFTQLAQIIPDTVYDYLHKKFGGCPPVTALNICQTCLDFNKRLLNEMELFIGLNKEAQNQNAAMTHLISNSWYAQWHKFVHKRNQEPPGPVDNSKINLSQVDPNECIEIPESIWNFFVRIYGGGPEIRIRQRINNLQRSESESSLHNSDNDNEAAPPFVIPNLTRDRYENNRLDRNSYCSGEPMEVDQIEPELLDCGSNGDLDGEKVTNGDAAEHRLTNGYGPVAHSKMADDTNGSEDDVSNDIKISKRRRRRKALLPSIN